MKLHSKEYPATHLLNPKREYVNAASTDIAQTFARIRAEQAKAQKGATVRQLRSK